MTLRRAALITPKSLANLPLLSRGVGVGKLWPRGKIAALEAKQHSSGDPQGIAKGIEQVALAHHLVSSQTSLVAIDTAKSRPDGKVVTTTDLPVILPDGWVYDKVFGRSPAGGLRAALPSNPVSGLNQAVTPQATASNLSAVVAMAGGSAPVPVPKALPDPVGKAEAEAPKPQVTSVTPPQMASPEASGAAPSTSNAQQRQIGMFVLLLIILSAVTLLMWRHYRRDYASPRRIGRRI